MWKTPATSVALLSLFPSLVLAQPRAISVTGRYIASETVLYTDQVVPRADRSTELGVVGVVDLGWIRLAGGGGPDGSGAMRLGFDKGIVAQLGLPPVLGLASAVQVGWGQRRVGSSSLLGGRRTAIELHYDEYVVGWSPHWETVWPVDRERPPSVRIGGFIGTSYRRVQQCQVSLTFISQNSGIICPCDHPGFGIAFDGLDKDALAGILGEFGATVTIPVGKIDLLAEATIAGFPYADDSVTNTAVAGEQARTQTSAASFGFGLGYRF